MEKKRPQRRPLCLLGAVVVLSPHRAPNPGPTSNEKHRGTAWNYQSRQALRREPAARPASVALRERGGEPEEAGSEVEEAGSGSGRGLSGRCGFGPEIAPVGVTEEPVTGTERRHPGTEAC